MEIAKDLDMEKTSRRAAKKQNQVAQILIDDLREGAPLFVVRQWHGYCELVMAGHLSLSVVA